MPSTPAAIHLRQRAAALTALARRLQQLSVMDLYRSAGPDTWVGPSPHACFDDLRHRRELILQQADALLSASRRFLRTADEMDARAAALAGAS